MANQERVVFIAEVRDEATADLGKINKSIDDTTKKVEDSGKRTERSTSRSTTALERFSSGGSKAFQRFSGGMRTHLDKGLGALGDLGRRISESDTLIGRMVRGGSRGMQNLAAGFKSPADAASNLTGMMGTLGGAVRSGMDSVAGLASSVGSAVETAITKISDLGVRMQEIGPKVSGVGGTLTKAITLPAAGAATAVAGITAKLGWDRLTSLDSAQAQLRGLGYESQDVERITGDLVTTLEGGMMTMGDATSTAAGALAAGVSEGAELERYIQLVDAAAVGMGRSVDETAMIFGRVQGSGKLMTQELNMIEQYMPGFAAAMSDSLGVGQDEFRSLVTEGEISSNQFMDVMESFAGGMATEYAESWEGMLANTKNYIGILGESLLGGVFEQSKESIAGFVDFLASDEVAAWATSVGESIGNAFETVIGWVQSAIEWWTSLDGSTQRLIGIIAGIAVALGPVLIAIGTTITVVGKLLGTLAFLANPITWIIAGIAALTAGLTWFFTQTEIGQTIVSTAWEWIQTAIAATVTWMTETAWPLLQAAWEGIASGAEWLWGVLVATWEWIQGAVEGVVTWFTETALPVLQGFWQGIVDAAVGFWEFVQPILTGFVDAWMWVAQLLMTIYLTVILVVWELFTSLITWVWESIVQPIFQFFVDAFTAVGEGFVWVWENVLQPVFDFFGTVITWLWENVIQPYFQQMGESFQRLGSFFVLVWEEYLQPAINWLGDLFMWLWTDVIQPVIGWVIERWQIMAETMALFYVEHIRPLIQRFGEIMTGLYNNYISPAIGWIMDRWHGLAEGLSNIWTQNIRPVLDRVGEFFTETIPGWVQTGVDIIAGIWDTVTGIFAVPINWVLENVWNKGIVAAFNKAADTVGFSGRLEEAGMIGSRGGSAGGSATSGRGGGAAFAAARAEGGPVSAGVPYLVGEEGPEIITPSRSGWVHTADETRNMLGTDAPGGLGIGAPTVGATSQIATWFATSDNAAAEWGRDKAGNLVQWVRGKAADAFSAVMEPLVDSIQESRVVQGSGRMGGLAGAYIDYGVGKVAEWLRGKEDEHNAAAAAAGFSDEPFTANPGGFNRPAAGIISSRAGRRAYQGAFGGMHYGVDIANSIGTAIRAAWSGVVKSVSGSGMDQRLVLNHGSYDTAYFHNSAILASPGDTVTGGQQIARMGTAGTGPHLHFEYHPGGWYNPSIAGVNALFDDGGILGTGTTIAQNNTGLPEFVLTNRRFGQVEDALDYVSANLPMPHHTGRGGDTISIDRRNIVSENAVNITVENTGHGFMTPEGLDEIKEAFEEILQESQRRDY